MVTERIRVGIVGANVSYGWGTRAHIPAIKALPEFELVAVCTTRKETAAETAEQFDVRLSFDDHRDLVSHPDVDLVLVCVRVPSHDEIVTSALEAGKHVFCEWPLGANSGQAIAMRDLAESKGVRHMVGLQARGAPVFNRVRELVADGYVGDVLSATMYSSSAGAGQRTPTFAWAADSTQGASTLTIPGGHSLDALRFCLGEFQEISAIVSTQMRTATIVDPDDGVAGEVEGATTKQETVDVTSPDNVLVSGELESGAVVSAHIKSSPAHGNGFMFEISGSRGTLIISSEGSSQIGDLSLSGVQQGDSSSQAISISENNLWVPNDVPEGPPLNVAQLFRQLGEHIRDGSPVVPDFTTAVTMHKVLDAIQRASDTGQKQSL